MTAMMLGKWMTKNMYYFDLFVVIVDNTQHKSDVLLTKFCSSNNALDMKILTEVFTVKKNNVVYSKLS